MPVAARYLSVGDQTIVDGHYWHCPKNPERKSRVGGGSQQVYQSMADIQADRYQPFYFLVGQLRFRGWFPSDISNHGWFAFRRGVDLIPLDFLGSRSSGVCGAGHG